MRKQKNARLKDIAEDLNISLTTVHRALKDKSGISDKMKEAVLQRAKEYGYTPNYLASSLKRHTIRIVVLLQSPKGYGKMYYQYMWDAVRSFEEEANSLNVEVIYEEFEESAGDQVSVLKRIFSEQEGRLDGLLTVPLENNRETEEVLLRFSLSGISVILIDNDVPESGRLCCIAPHDTFTGRLAAEFLHLMQISSGVVLIGGGSRTVSSHIYNLLGFSEYLKEKRSPLETMVLYEYEDMEKLYRRAFFFLKEREDIVAVYAITSRETVPLARAVADSGKAGRIKAVGSDLFPESARYLREGILQGIVDKNAYDKGIRGFSLLLSYLVKNILPPSERILVPISMIMQNNLTFFQERLKES